MVNTVSSSWRATAVIYDDDFREAARRAESGVKRAIRSLQGGKVRREDDLSGVLKGNLDAELEGKIGNLQWDCTILDHSSGQSAEEWEYGADLLIHVRFKGRHLQYDKGVLIQAKKLNAGQLISRAKHNELKGQCNDMLEYSPESFVWIYSNAGMRSAPATAIVGSSDRDLNELTVWTSYRFFWELFRCPVGDEKIVSPYPADLRPRVTADVRGREARDA
jgi:hypothetical protein